MTTPSFELVKQAIERAGDALFHAYIPVEKHHVKKNNRQIMRDRRTGRPFIGKSNSLKTGELRLTSDLKRALLKYPHLKSIDFPIWCVFLFYFPASDFVVKSGPRKGKLSQRLPDLSNLYELPQDCLTAAGVIEDDHLICSHDLSRRLPAKSYGLEIFIFRHWLDLATKPHLMAVSDSAPQP